MNIKTPKIKIHLEYYSRGKDLTSAIRGFPDKDKAIDWLESFKKKHIIKTAIFKEGK